MRRTWPLFLLLGLAAPVGATAGRPPDATPFVADGVIGTFGSDTGDATQVTSLVAASDSVVRFVVGFGRKDGLPAATLGPVCVEFLRSLRVIRIHLPSEVRDAAITERWFAQDFLRHAYVVGSLDEGNPLFVDLHLMDRPCVARAWVRSSPAVMVVELKPGGPAMPKERFNRGPDGGVVVLSPLGEHAAYPLEIAGYGHTFEANVVGRLRKDGAVVADTFTTHAGPFGLWGEFRLRFPTGPRGKIELFVRGDSPGEGDEPRRERGVLVPLVIE